MDFVIDGASKLTEEGGKFREFGEVIWKLCGLDNLKPFEPPDKQRPFLSPIVWALFSAYRQVLTLPVVQVAALKTGGGRKILADTSRCETW